MFQLIPVLVLAVFVVVFGVGLMFAAMGLSKLFGSKVKQSATKLESYECGVDVSHQKTTKIPIKFYLTAILFILFDIEIIFMYPWAMAYDHYITEMGMGIYIFSAMAVFLAVFIFGLFWEIKSRALEWE
jgi:NADH-quinone oxidoreductase subunit A